MLHIGELSDFLKYCNKRNELSLPHEVISTGLGFFLVCFCIAQLKLFEISTEHFLEKQVNQFFIAEIGPESASVPFKKFIQERGKPHDSVILCVYGWEKLNHY